MTVMTNIPDEFKVENLKVGQDLLFRYRNYTRFGSIRAIEGKTITVLASPSAMDGDYDEKEITWISEADIFELLDKPTVEDY